jgi:hypothetical protein
VPIGGCVWMGADCMSSNDTWLSVSTVPGVRPGGRPTFLSAQESRQRKRPEKTAPAGSPALLERRGPRPTRAATLCSNSGAESVLEARCAQASPFCAARRFLRGSFETASSRKPTAKPESRWPRGISGYPLESAEQRKVLRPRAQRASRTDSARLFEQSVAARVARGASRPEQRRAPAAQRRADGTGATLCLLSGRTESRSPAGANSRHRTCQQPAGS